MTAEERPPCRRCGEQVVASGADYDLFEGMHWRCFHYAFEHWGLGETDDPDVPCDDPSCPARPRDSGEAEPAPA